jgi:hypothetical protein
LTFFEEKQPNFVNICPRLIQQSSLQCFDKPKNTTSKTSLLCARVPDPDQNPDPPDPHVFGPPDPDPLVTGMDPAPYPDPSIIKQK